MAGILDGAVQSLIAARQMKTQAAMEMANMAYRQYMGQIAMQRLNDNEQYHQGVLQNDQNKNQLFSERTRSQLAGQMARADATTSSAELRHKDAQSADDIRRLGQTQSALSALGRQAYANGVPFVSAFGPLAQSAGISLKGTPNEPSPLAVARIGLAHAQEQHMARTDQYHDKLLNLEGIKTQQQYQLGVARVNLLAKRVSGEMTRLAFDETHMAAQDNALHLQAVLAKAKLDNTLHSYVGQTIGVMKGLSSVMAETQAKIASVHTAMAKQEATRAMWQSYVNQMNAAGNTSMETSGANPITITLDQAQSMVNAANNAINGNGQDGGYMGTLASLQNLYSMDSKMYKQYSQVVSGQQGNTPVLRTRQGQPVANAHRILAPGHAAASPVVPSPKKKVPAKPKTSSGIHISGPADQQKKANDILKALGG